MRKVELTQGIQSSVLGFGCAPILGAVGGKTAKYSLDFALDHGINYLDLARSYGFGNAEKFVGKIIKGKRHEIVLASKFGIEPNWKASIVKSLTPLVRSLRNQIKKNNHNKSLPAPANGKTLATNFFKRIEPLRGKDMRRSLEKSLQELQTDHLDYFFIHEPYQELPYLDELSETYELLKAEGKIRAWGIAYTHSQQELHSSYLDAFDLLQFNKPTETDEYKNLVLKKGLDSNIIFSPLAGNNSMTPNEKLKTLLDDFPNSVILCSMFNLEHLKQNINIAGLTSGVTTIKFKSELNKPLVGEPGVEDR